MVHLWCSSYDSRGFGKGAATLGPVDRPTQPVMSDTKAIAVIMLIMFNRAATVGPAAEIMEPPKCSWRDII